MQHNYFIAETDKCINDIAEYEVVLLGLHKLQAMGVQHCSLKTYSMVIASQIEKECMADELARGWKFSLKDLQSNT
jgi:ribonuclease HI